MSRMANRRRSNPEDVSGEVEALAHARHAWDAEVENARRLGQRTSVLITIEAALLGLGATRATAPPVAPFVRGLFVASALFVAAGLLLLLRPRLRSGRPAQASLLLLGSAKVFAKANRASATEMTKLALQNTLHAAIDLGVRNARKQRDIDHAQIGFLLAALAWTAAGVCWLTCGARS